ncbi:polysaccharide pyruvyl transferase family protein, partial [Salmonella enterica subsp. enterica]|nr:polysaccharide pyruvyl transferase family protein [Salmonella enterica subsp. enterica]
TLVRAHQLVLGYRLHGNLMALANGVPSIYFTYDSRTAEFAETYKIPSYDVFGGKPFRLEDYWDQSLFDKYNRAWFETYGEMNVFLTENGVDHKMTETGRRASDSARRVA